MTKIILIALALTFGCALTFESVNAAEGYTPPEKFTRVFKTDIKNSKFFKDRMGKNKNQRNNRQQSNTASSDEERTASMTKTSNPGQQQNRQTRKSRHSTPSQNRVAQRNAPKNSSNGGLNN